MALAGWVLVVHLSDQRHHLSLAIQYIHTMCSLQISLETLEGLESRTTMELRWPGNPRHLSFSAARALTSSSHGMRQTSHQFTHRKLSNSASLLIAATLLLFRTDRPTGPTRPSLRSRDTSNGDKRPRQVEPKPRVQHTAGNPPPQNTNQVHFVPPWAKGKQNPNMQRDPRRHEGSTQQASVNLAQ